MGIDLNVPWLTRKPHTLGENTAVCMLSSSQPTRYITAVGQEQVGKISRYFATLLCQDILKLHLGSAGGSEKHGSQV